MDIKPGFSHEDVGHPLNGHDTIDHKRVLACGSAGLGPASIRHADRQRNVADVGAVALRRWMPSCGHMIPRTGHERVTSGRAPSSTDVAEGERLDADPFWANVPQLLLVLACERVPDLLAEQWAERASQT